VSRRLAQIRLRRERLIARAAVERDGIALLASRLRAPLALADRGVLAVQYVRMHPGIVVLAVAAFVVLSPRRALRWARRGVYLWRGYRWALQLLGPRAS